MERRPLLAAAWTTAATVAGCPGSAGDPTAEVAAHGEPATDGGEAGDVPEPRGPVRGEHDPIDVRAVERDDEVEYLPETEAVRYVAAWRHANHDEVANGSAPPTREPVYETTSFEDWAATRCSSAAASAAADHANDALDTDAVGGGIASAVPDHALAAVLVVGTTLDREGNVVGESDVAFEALVDATPRTVTATYVLADREHERAVPVFARYEVLQQD